MSSYSTITFDAIGKDAQLFRTKQSENQMTLSLQGKSDFCLCRNIELKRVYYPFTTSIQKIFKGLEQPKKQLTDRNCFPQENLEMFCNSTRVHICTIENFYWSN